MSLFQFFIWFYVAIWLNISLSACSCWLSVCLVLSVARPLEMMRNDCGGVGGGCIVEKIISLHWADKQAFIGNVNTPLGPLASRHHLSWSPLFPAFLLQILFCILLCNKIYINLHEILWII